MVLCGAAIMPHGALILQPDRPEMAEIAADAQQLHDGCCAAAAAIAACAPDIILLYTPHGLIAEGVDMNVYTGSSSASGTCEWMGAWANYAVKVALDPSGAASLLAALKDAGCSAAGLSAFSGYDAPLRWGEAVPLLFLRTVTASAKVIILSHAPANTGERCRTAAGRLPATEVMGATIGEWAAASASRVFLLISGDLAHVHGNGRAPRAADGTADPKFLNPKYPDADDSAAPFEAAVLSWASQIGRDRIIGRSGKLCKDALELLPSAMCCGFDGFVMLHVALQKGAPELVGAVLAHAVPVYFGMMVATFLPPGVASAAASPRHLELTAPALSALGFDGRVVLVSGAGHGFGRAIALAFASLGAIVHACDGPGGATVEAELCALEALATGLRGTIVASVVDFRSEAAVAAWASAEETVDVLVHCAGGVLGTVGGSIEEASSDAWDAIFDVNVRAAFVACRAAAPALRRSTAGRIVTISSGAGQRPSLTGIAAYCSAKHALVGLTKQLALELGADGVTVNSVAPGFVRSNPSSEAQWQALGDDGQARMVQNIFTRRLGAPSDIASAVLFLASDAAGWVTGQVLAVDGGRA